MNAQLTVVTATVISKGRTTAHCKTRSKKESHQQRCWRAFLAMSIQEGRLTIVPTHSHGSALVDETSSERVESSRDRVDDGLQVEGKISIQQGRPRGRERG
jgi:hypothetical protein